MYYKNLKSLSCGSVLDLAVRVLSLVVCRLQRCDTQSVEWN